MQENAITPFPDEAIHVPVILRPNGARRTPRKVNLRQRLGQRRAKLALLGHWQRPRWSADSAGSPSAAACHGAGVHD